MTRPPLSFDHRAGLLVATGALVVAGLYAVPAAEAADTLAAMNTISSMDSSAKDSGSCIVTGDNETAQAEQLNPGETVTHAVDTPITVAFSEDPADTQELRLVGESTGRLVESGGEFERLGMQMTSSVTGGASLGAETQCQSFARFRTVVEGETVLPAAGFIELTLRTSGDIEATVGAEQRSTAVGTSLTVGSQLKFARGTTGDARVFVEAGPIVFYGFGLLGVDLPERDSGPISRRGAAADELASGAMSAEVTFVEAGSPLSPARGAGRRFVDLGARSCAGDTVATRLKRPARRADTITYFLDGKKVRTLRDPRPRARVRVEVPPRSEATLKAVVKPARGAKVTVTRSYVACAG